MHWESPVSLIMNGAIEKDQTRGNLRALQLYNYRGSGCATLTCYISISIVYCTVY